MILDIGAGKHVQRDAVGIDKRALPGIGIVHDLEEFPWPLEDSSCELLYCVQCIEHIKPCLQIEFMDEIWRIAQPNAMLILVTPYGGSHRWHKEPTHCASWNEETINHFLPEVWESYRHYEPKPWKKISQAWNPLGDIELRIRAIK